MKTLLLSILICVSFVVLGKGDAPGLKSSIEKNTFYFELGGNGGFYSVNYDRIILRVKIVHLSIRTGYSVFPSKNNEDFNYIIPLEAILLFGEKNNFLELGAGKSIEYESNNNSSNITTFRFGYRYISDKGLMARAGVVPIVFSLFGNDVVGIWAGLGIGYAF